MAPTKDQTVTDNSQSDKLAAEFQTSKNSMLQFRVKWDDFLDTAYARLTTSNGYKSRVREGSLSSLLWERSARVVAQLPTGRIQYLSAKDRGKSELMDIIFHKYVMRGANTDYSYLTKLRMWDYYSLIYGAAPALYDYRVDDEYVGPDWAVLDPRYVFPQAGRLSFQRCQFVFIEAFHNKEYLKSKRNLPGWNTIDIDFILANYSDGTMPDNTRKVTNLQQDRGQTVDLHKGEIQLITKYEKGKNGHWVTFAPQYDNRVVRDIPNPHKSGRLPVVFKFCLPLIDSLWGMGDVERGQSLQNAIDSFVNLSMDFAKFKLYPPMWYADGVNPSQLRYEPAAKWRLPNGQNSAGFMEIGGSYSQEFTQGYQFMSGALNRQNGTTTTQVATGQGDPSQGKTPQAIDKNTATENSRDNFDTAMLEEAHESLANGMINLIGTKQPATIEFHIFDEDIKKIYDAGFKDVLEVFDSGKKPKVTDDGQLDWEPSGKGAAKISASPTDTKGAYLYFMDSGTTRATDDEKEYNRLEQLGQDLASPEGQQMVQALSQQGRQFDYAEYFKKRLIASGIDDWESLIPEIHPAQQQGAQQFDPSMLQDPQSQAMYQQMQGGQPGMPGQPQPGAGNPAQVAQDQSDAMTKMIEDKATEIAKTMVAQKGKAPQELISYKDASPLTKAHMEAAAGFTPDPVHVIEEQALMAGHAQTAHSSNVQMNTPPVDPNMQQEQGSTTSSQPVNSGVGQ